MMFKSRDRPMPEPTYMSSEQKGQQSHMSLSPAYAPSRASRLREWSTSIDIGSQAELTAQYLSDLRAPQLTRPSGSRPPPPPRFGVALRRTGTDLVAAAEPTEDRPALPTSNSMPNMPGPRMMHRRAESDISTTVARSPFAGRPIAQAPSVSVLEQGSASPTKPVIKRTPSMTYMENGMRWMEKQEVKSLRRALEEMDLEKDTMLHAAAQDEAAELVWKHQNPDASIAGAEAPYPNPDLQRDYHAHLRKGSYQRSHSQDATSTPSQRSGSDGSQRSGPDTIVVEPSVNVRAMPKATSPIGAVFMPKTRSVSGKSHDELSSAVADDIANANRRTSSGSRRILSGSRKLAMRPGDRIWEDPQEEGTPPKRELPRSEEPRPSVPTLPSHIRKNPFARVRMQHDRMERSNSAPVLPMAPMLPTVAEDDPSTRLDRVEIQKNPPSQSRNPWYLSNEPLPPITPNLTGSGTDEVSSKGTTPKAEKEIRGDDIRAATSKQRKDYSANLPRPTMVSDKPGRPIVSFQRNIRPKEVVLEEIHSPPSRMRVGASNSRSGMPCPPVDSERIPRFLIEGESKPPIPSISLPDTPAIPTIVLPEEPDFATANMQSEPTTPMNNFEDPRICVSSAHDAHSPRSKIPQRPLPSTRPMPHHAATSPLPRTKSTPHYTPSIRPSGALCAQCALPIAGRILSAAGERFHPGCFVCHQCETNLELVAFYPEPERRRSDRIERIHARQTGMDIPLSDGVTSEEALQQEMDDGDATPRFYCHLDFHELFSPRCKSCKTPIEGEIIVACGAEWHAGHFFCAQCGDPFDSTTPFVEKDGYAWCVGCHTNRYSSKCRKCKKPVTDVVVKALGADWHGSCFVCVECNGEFDDGRYFLRGESQDPVCVKCEERRLKA